MGEITEGILSGDFCQECGVYIGDDACYPRSCADCEGRSRTLIRRPDPVKVKCPKCGKVVKESGMRQHMNYKHPRG